MRRTLPRSVSKESPRSNQEVRLPVTMFLAFWPHLRAARCEFSERLGLRERLSTAEGGLNRHPVAWTMSDKSGKTIPGIIRGQYNDSNKRKIKMLPNSLWTIAKEGSIKLKLIARWLSQPFFHYLKGIQSKLVHRTSVFFYIRSLYIPRKVVFQTQRYP